MNADKLLQTLAAYILVAIGLILLAFIVGGTDVAIVAAIALFAGFAFLVYLIEYSN